MAEYIIVVAFVATAAIALYLIFGSQIRSTLSSFGTQLTADDRDTAGAKMEAEEYFGQSAPSEQEGKEQGGSLAGSTAKLADHKASQKGYDLFLIYFGVGLLIIAVILFMMFFLRKRK